MRNILRKPPRKAPTLLTIPNRDRIISIFERFCNEPHHLITMELERRQTLTNGEVSVLMAFVRELGGVLPQHIMPRQFTDQNLEGAAQILGQSAAQALRRKAIEDGTRGRGITRSI